MKKGPEPFSPPFRLGRDVVSFSSQGAGNGDAYTETFVDSSLSALLSPILAVVTQLPGTDLLKAEMEAFAQKSKFAYFRIG
jgi:hypothetical protein